MSLQVTAINYSLGGLLVAGAGFCVIDSRASDKSKSSWPIKRTQKFCQRFRDFVPL